MKYKFDEVEYSSAIISLKNNLDFVGIYTEFKIKRESIPTGLFAYDIRSDDDGEYPYCTVEKDVVANHNGTFITREEIPMFENTQITINGQKSTDSYSTIDCFILNEMSYKEDWRKEYIRE